MDPSLTFLPHSQSEPPMPAEDDAVQNARLMQVKVLYTFDDDKKSNCLARGHHPQLVQTAFLEDGLEIGIIELRTCIQAIVSASPELVARLGQDYTVYAYDYSEYETPLVGQGMLSWVLASASITPTASADQSRTMVTGRVTQNVLGLFSTNGVKETLDVKLRLLPVPTCLQSDYLASMEKYRDASNMASDAFDPAAWAAFLRHNPGFALTASQSQNTEHATYHWNDQVQFAQPIHNQRQDHVHQSQHPTTHSRPATPSYAMTSVESQSRPSSAHSTNQRPAIKHAMSCTSRLETTTSHHTSEAEEGPSRKRAKVQTIGWHGRSSFGAKPESLRVAASSAASIRGNRPTTAHPSASEIAAGELLERPPTPRPMPPRRLKGNDTTNTRPSLSRQASTSYRSPYTFTHAQHSMPDPACDSSPEKLPNSAASTPFDVPSSPPVMSNISISPSSPMLPSLLNHPDSGFVSGTADECSHDDDDLYRLINEDTNTQPQVYGGGAKAPAMSDFSITEEVPGDPSLLPQRMLPRPPVRQNTVKRRTQSNAPSSPKLPPLQEPKDISQSGTHNSQQKMATDAQLKPLLTAMDKVRRESEACMHDAASEAASPATLLDDATTNTKQSVGSGLKRKKAIQQRLQSDLAAGKMPPYCKNCGEINTPTWRKCFVRNEQGSPTEILLSENDEGILAWETTEKEKDGDISSYRVIKKSITTEDVGFEEMQLCNPCGIWLFKFRSMRPPEKWAASQNRDQPPPRKRPSRSKKLKANEADSQDSSLTSANAGSEESSRPCGNQEFPSGRSDRSQPQSDGKRTRAASDDMVRPALPEHPFLSEAAAAAALQKAIQSSPPKFPGSKHTPINLDDDVVSEPLRRLLFPSPRRPGQVLSLEPSIALVANSARSPDDCRVTDVQMNDKENRPLYATDIGERNLLKNKHPTTPASSASKRQSPKTPLGSSGSKTKAFLTSAAKRWCNDIGTSSRAESHSRGNGEMTPFSKHLSHLMSDANQSPTEGSDRALKLFGETLPDGSGMFAFSDFSAEDWTGLAMPSYDEGTYAFDDEAHQETSGPWSDSQQQLSSFDALMNGSPEYA